MHPDDKFELPYADSGIQEHDLPEFLIFIIDCFHTSIMREVNMKIKGKVLTDKDKVAKKCYSMMKNMYKKEYSEILDIFYGIHVSCVNTIGRSIRIGCSAMIVIKSSLEMLDKSIWSSLMIDSPFLTNSDAFMPNFSSNEFSSDTLGGS